MENTKLGKEKIGKLLLSFAIPSVISMLVNSIYNIVDQIFIGQNVGYLGNAATNVVFPLVVVATALALLFGDGASSFLSLSLGEKDIKKAKKGIGATISAVFILAIVLFLICFIFLPQLLQLLGATENTMQYALDYGRIIVIGFPFMIIYTALNSIIRADGSPKYSMVSMASGAILNIVLDYLFVVVFEWGIEGAAIATVIGQVVSFIISFSYLFRFKSFKLKLKDLKINSTIKKVASYGVSSAITQLTIVAVVIVMNNALTKYGADSKYGEDIPLSVYGIVMKVNQIFMSIVIGIAVGGQPIIGYNYGANNIPRVKETIKTIIKIICVVGIIATIGFQFFGKQIISIFGSESDLYNEFAVLCFRFNLMLTLLNSFQIFCGILFQSLGKPKYAAICSLSRQIIFLIPAILIFGYFFGVMGCICAGILADALAFILATILFARVYKKLGKEKLKKENIEEKGINTDYIENSSEHIVITISREYGSGGRFVGQLLAEKLGIKFYDKELIKVASEESGLSEEYIQENEQKKISAEYSGDDRIFVAESNSIKNIAQNNSCVIVGRCADYILKDEKNVLKLFLYSDDESKVKRAVTYYNLDEKKALKEINKINKEREKHYKFYTDRNWKDFNNYDLAINVDTLGVEETVEAIVKLVELSRVAVK